MAYIAQKSNGKRTVVVDEVEVKEHDGVVHYIFSPDSKRVAYVAVDNKKQMLVVDGVESKERYDRIHNMTFSPDSSRLAYIGMHNDRDSVRLAGEIYRLKRGDRMITVLMGELQGKGQCDRVYGLVFSPDSKRLAYAATRDGRYFAAVDGAEQAEYDQVCVPIFSPDSRHIVYSAKREDRWFFMVDGVEGPEYDNPIENLQIGTLDWRITYQVPIIFDPDNPAKFYTTVTRDQRTLRLEVEITEK